MRKINNNLLSGFKREELSSLTGIGYWTLLRILQGKREVTKTEQLALISVTGLSAEELFIVVEDDKEAS